MFKLKYFLGENMFFLITVEYIVITNVFGIAYLIYKQLFYAVQTNKTSLLFYFELPLYGV